jgi:hypothetical protein
MAAKPPSYAAVELAPIAPAPTITHATEDQAKRKSKENLKECSSQVMLYLHPEGARALKRYAVEQNTKVHTLLIEAIEAWFQSHGLREAVRVTRRST